MGKLNKSKGYDIYKSAIIKILNEYNDWKAFCVKYKLAHTPLKHINKTKSIKDWKNLYSIYPEASQLVYDLYKKDFEYFNYKIINFCGVV